MRVKDWFLNVAINPKKNKKECICRCITAFTQRVTKKKKTLIKKPQSIASYYYDTLCKYGFISSPSPKRLQRKLSVGKTSN